MAQFWGIEMDKAKKQLMDNIAKKVQQENILGLQTLLSKPLQLVNFENPQGPRYTILGAKAQQQVKK